MQRQTRGLRNTDTPGSEAYHRRSDWPAAAPGFRDKPVKSADDCFSLLSHSPTLRFPRPLSTVLATQRRESRRDRAATEPHGAAIGDLRLGLRQRGKAIIFDPEVTRSS